MSEKVERNSRVNKRTSDRSSRSQPKLFCSLLRKTVPNRHTGDQDLLAFLYPNLSVIALRQLLQPNLFEEVLLPPGFWYVGALARQ
jgi:hypothetical protein